MELAPYEEPDGNAAEYRSKKPCNGSDSAFKQVRAKLYPLGANAFRGDGRFKRIYPDLKCHGG